MIDTILHDRYQIRELLTQKAGMVIRRRNNFMVKRQRHQIYIVWG
jgi:hypothetical protein